MAGSQPHLVSPLEAEEVDDILRLPDDIIHHIFSFLPLKDLVKTSVLSKQWRFVWTSTPYIHLFLPSTDVVVPLIDRTLNRCTAAKIEKFHLDTTKLFLSIPEELDRLFCFAVARRVEDVSLMYAYGKAKVPKVLCDCESLVSLQVSRCPFPEDAISINWPSLKKLCIQCVRLDNNKIMEILSGCPVLESLSLIFCLPSETELRIDSATLRELVIYVRSTRSLHIRAPNLLSLNVRFISRPKEEISLTGADLNFDEPSAVTGSSREKLKLLPVRIHSNLVGWKLVHHENYRGNSQCGQIPPALMWQEKQPTSGREKILRTSHMRPHFCRTRLPRML